MSEHRTAHQQLDRPRQRDRVLRWSSVLLSAVVLVVLLVGLFLSVTDPFVMPNPLVLGVAGLLTLPGAVIALLLARRWHRRAGAEAASGVRTLARVALGAAVLASAPGVIWAVMVQSCSSSGACL